MIYGKLSKTFLPAYPAGAALERVLWVPVNPWISKIFPEEPMRFDMKSDPKVFFAEDLF